MPPRVTSKLTPLVNRNIYKTNTLKVRSSPRLKSLSMAKNTTNKDISKALSTPFESKKQASNTNKNSLKENVSGKSNTKPVTPKTKTTRSEAESATKSAKKSGWKRRPKPAHSGVPVPEKMKKMLAKFLLDDDEKL